VLEEFQQDYGLTIDFYCDHACQGPVEEQEFRFPPGELVAILREALQNVARHAHATAVRVTMTREGRNLVLSVKDNGAGFSPQQAEAWPKPGHHGLVNMRARAASLGGTLSIKSTRGEGTEVVVVLPCQQEARGTKQEAGV